MSPPAQPVSLSIDQIVTIKTPEAPAWSPDGTLLAYRLAGFDHGEIWVTDPLGEARAVTSGDEPAGPPVWDGNGRIVFTRGRGVHRVDLDSGEEQLILELPEGASRATVLPSADAVVYALDGDAWLWYWHDTMLAAAPIRMTEGQWLMTRMVHRITDVFFPSPDGLHIAIACPREHDLDLAVYSRVTDSLHWIMPGNDVETAAIWSPDGRKLAFTRYDWRVKWRELWVCEPDGEDPVRIWRDESKQWVSRPEFDATFSPHGSYVAFVAPIDDFGQVLVAHADGSNDPLQTSKPGAEAAKPRWSPNGDWISYLATEDRQKRLHIVNALHRDERYDPLQQACSVSDYLWAPTSHRLVAIVSTHDRPDYLLSFTPMGGNAEDAPEREPGIQIPESEAIQRIGTRPAGHTGRMIADHNDGIADRVGDVTISAMSVTSEDEEWEIPVLKMRRKDLPSDKSAPGILYIHGGGQGQYAVPAWQGYSNPGLFYAANLMLAQMGYVVCIVDYRGSWNYGRDYETASFLDVGGGDLSDIVAVTHWLGGQPQVDPRRIGVWGISYGGFMTTLCMVKEPQLYAAGVNLVGVFNWLDYYDYLSDRAPGTWSRSRFELPEEHPELYRERNPLVYIARLEKPYLALYGNDDANVPIDHCWQLVRALTEHDKDFDLVVYPDEPHVFTRPATWRDALRRTIRHFEEHL